MPVCLPFCLLLSACLHCSLLVLLVPCVIFHVSFCLVNVCYIIQPCMPSVCFLSVWFPSIHHLCYLSCGPRTLFMISSCPFYPNSPCPFIHLGKFIYSIWCDIDFHFRTVENTHLGRHLAFQWLGVFQWVFQWGRGISAACSIVSVKIV